jgi:hypothetical protein
VFIWSLIDLVRLGGVVEEQNARLVPAVQIGDGSLALGVSGRF